MSKSGASYFGIKEKKIKFSKQYKVLNIELSPLSNGTVVIGDTIVEVKDGKVV